MTPTEDTQMAIHLTLWISTARIVDMTNAHKRGKTCRVVELDAHTSTGSAFIRGTLTNWVKTPETKAAFGVFLPDVDFDTLLANIKARGTDDIYLREREIRGVDAPRETLSHTTETFSVTVNSSGVHLRDLVDRHNEPTMITSGQTALSAYSKAKKVWDKVTAATSYYEVADILRKAGCKLHSYCAVD